MARANSRPPRRHAVVVLGMHRSGTSMLAGLLEHLGCVGPNTPLPASATNPAGYFESKRINHLNDEIMRAAGSNWQDWRPLREDWHHSPRFDEFRLRIGELIDEEYGCASLFQLKDPRLSRLFPIWHDVLKERGVTILCTHTHRHPFDVARSLEARKSASVDFAVGMLMWLRYTLDAEASTRGQMRIFSSYTRLMENWKGFVASAETKFGIIWPTTLQSAQRRISAFVDKDLRHHESDVVSYLNDALVPEIFRLTLEILESWVTSGESEKDYPRLDALKSEFDRLAPVLEQPVAALTETSSDLRKLRGEQAAMQNTLTHAQQELAAAMEQIARLEAENARHLKEQASAIAAEREALDKMKIENTDLRRKLDESQSLVATQVEALSIKEKQLLSDAAQLQALQSEADLRSGLLAERDQALSEAALRMTELEQRHSDDTEKLHTLEAEVKLWSDRVIERDQRTAKLVFELEDIRSKRSGKNAVANSPSLSSATPEVGSPDYSVQMAHMREIERLHHEYRNSTSWRVSAPVRFVGRLLARNRN